MNIDHEVWAPIGALADQRRQIRLRNFFALVADWHHPNSWPLYIQRMAVEEHKDNRTRYKLFVFFWLNGVPPHVAKEWVMAKDYVNGELVYEEYDAPAIGQLRDLVTKAIEGTLNWGSVYDIHQERVAKKNV